MSEVIVDTKHFGVGLDTARYGHHASFLDEQKQIAHKPFHFLESSNGYRELDSALYTLASKHQSVHCDVHFHIHVDSAGQYSENLLQWLQNLRFPHTISVGQPARNQFYRKVHFEKRKADPVDSLACARFAIVERPNATPVIPPALRQLRDLVAQVEAASKQHTRLVNQLHGLLAKIFPELAVHAKDLSANWVLSLLEKYPTPERLSRAKLESLVKIPHLDEPMAKVLQAAAVRTTASSQGEVAEQMVQSKVHALRQHQENISQLLKLVEKSWSKLPPGPHQRVITIKGIGCQTAAALVAKIGSIERFPTAAALVGYFGVFPEEVNASGTEKDGTPKRGTIIKMSSKGNDLVRRLLYTAAQVAARWNPPVRDLFNRLKAKGKDYECCIGHCMAKLLRQVFGVWTKDCDFDPNFENRRRANVTDGNAPTPIEEEKTVVGHKNADEPPSTVVSTTDGKVSSPHSERNRRPLNLAQVRQRVSISQILEHLDWNPQSSRGAQLRGRCLVHEEVDAQSRDFAVNTQKNAYCCHQCGSQGNALDLWAAVHNLPILEAAWSLVEKFQIEPPLLNERPSGKEKIPNPDSPLSGTRKQENE